MSTGISEATRRLLIQLARKSTSRDKRFTPRRPTDWRPRSVRNPDSWSGYFTDTTAWEFIATKLEEGEKVDVVDLHHPKGATGYQMLIEMGNGAPKLYVKLQLGSSQVFGRSFHYTEGPC